MLVALVGIVNMATVTVKSFTLFFRNTTDKQDTLCLFPQIPTSNLHQKIHKMHKSQKPQCGDATNNHCQKLTDAHNVKSFDTFSIKQFKACQNQASRYEFNNSL
jgi:hypothetical protein